jgi:glucose-6-phosphate 1-dehydrogenase
MDNAPQITQERSAPPATLVIFGASGDLTRRKLLPAVESLARHRRLPAEFALVGVARTAMDDQQFIDKSLGERGLQDMPQLDGGIRYVSGGYDDPETYKRLAEVLDELDAQRGTAGNRLFYLSTPAEAFKPVIHGLACTPRSASRRFSGSTTTWARTPSRT